LGSWKKAVEQADKDIAEFYKSQRRKTFEDLLDGKK